MKPTAIVLSRSTFVSLLACVMLASCAPKQPGVKNGSMSGHDYEAPGRLFAVPIPAGQHVKVNDGRRGAGAFVTFVDDLGVFHEVDWTPANDADREALAGDDRVDALRTILHGSVMDTLRAASPISTILEEEPVKLNGHQAYFAVAQLPGRARVRVDDSQGGWRRGDDLRAVLVFTHGNWVLVVMYSESPMDETVHPTSDFERMERLKKGVIQFANTIHFRDDVRK